MALVSSLFTAITGMRNHQTMLDVISNNVANVNTVGFKAGRVQFRDLLSQTISGAAGSDPVANRGGTNPVQFGTGVAVASIDTSFRQGTLQATGNATDLAINGDGFFVTKTGSSTLYTRAGSFRFDSLGRLVDTSGGLIQGWSAQTPTTNPLAPMEIDSSNPANIGNITINAGSTIQPLETSNVALVGNLDAGANSTNLANSAGQANTRQLTVFGYDPVALTESQFTYTVGTFTMPMRVYDSLGNAHDLSATLTNVSNTQIAGAPIGQVYDNNTWAWSVDTDPTDTTVHLALDNSTYTDPVSGDVVRASSSGLIHFNTNGSLDWVVYGDRNAEKFGTSWDQTQANDANIPGTNLLGTPPLPSPLANPGTNPDGSLPGTDLWADWADTDVHNSTVIGFEGTNTVPVGDFAGDASQSTTPFGVPIGPPPGNMPYDNPGVTVGLAGPPAYPQDAFALLKLPIVLVYQNVPTGSPVPPSTTTAGRLVSMDVAGMTAASNNTIATTQQWYVQSVNVDWGTVSTITQADFDRADDATAVASAANEAAGVPAGTGDGTMDGSHTVAVGGGLGDGGEAFALGDRQSDLEMPWDPRVVRTSQGLRDGLTQDTTGVFQNIGGLNVYIPSFSVRMEAQDGYAQGILQGVSVQADGKVIGTYTNGVSIGLAQVAIANFENPAGLAKVGETHFVSTANSGSAVVGTALSGGRGSVIGGVVEQSNVDLSEELTNMIVAQRGFEVNARLITTSDRILDTLVNLGR